MSHIDDTADELRSLEAGAVGQLFEETTFPMTTAEILTEFADVDISYQNQSDTLGAILETSGHEIDSNNWNCLHADHTAVVRSGVH